MKCTDAGQLILLQDSGEISVLQQDALAQHMATCTACRQFSADLTRMRALITCSKHEWPGPSSQALLNIRLQAQKPRTLTPRILAHPWPIALAAAAGLILCLTVLRFSVLPLPAPNTQAGPGELASEIIPLIALITGNDTSAMSLEEGDAGLTALANELLRLQDPAGEWSEDTPGSITLPEDCHPTTLQWNNTRGLQSGKCG